MIMDQPPGPDPEDLPTYLAIPLDMLRALSADSIEAVYVPGVFSLYRSLLMARVANDLGNAKPEQQALYYHRFRAGDARNS